ncbi:hypothetical protein Hanom_Chr02g00115051 [Helianthus anomalus]
MEWCPCRGQKSTTKDHVVAEWRAQFEWVDWINKPSVKLYFDDILPMMRSFGKNFCLNFLVAFFTIIGHASDNAVVNKQFLHNVKPNIQINQMNWYGYII